MYTNWAPAPVVQRPPRAQSGPSLGQARVGLKSYALSGGVGTVAGLVGGIGFSLAVERRVTLGNVGAAAVGGLLAGLVLAAAGA